MRELNIVFRNKEQQKLIGVLSIREQEKSERAVILVHGFLADKNLHFFPQLANSLCEKGFVVLRFDARGCGESEGETHATYPELVEDVLCAASFLKQHHGIRSISLFGHSMGGSAVIVAAHRAHFDAVVTFGALAHVQGAVEQKRRESIVQGTTRLIIMKDKEAKLSEEFFTTIIHPLEVVKHLNAPLLIMHASDDERVSVAQAQELFITARVPKSYKRFSGTNHYGKNVYEDLVSAAAEFFVEHTTKKETDTEEE